MIKNILFTCFVLFTFSSCSNYHHLLRKPSIYDGKDLGRITLSEKNSDSGFDKIDNIELPSLNTWVSDKAGKKYNSVDKFLADKSTTAFLIIRNDSIVYENYYNGMTDTSLTQVFSITKPIVTSLLAFAIEDGLLEDLHQPVSDYVNLTKKRKYIDDLEIYHVAQMISGINHNDYFHLIRTLRLYYHKDMDLMIAKLRVAKEPGKKFAYKSVSTQLLGTILEQLYPQGVGEVFTKRVWNKLYPEYPLLWSVDSDTSKNLKYYGGINAHPRDLAKFGKMYMNDGKYDGEQILPKSWTDRCLEKEERKGKHNYCFGWWFDEYSEDHHIYYGAGFNGQYLMLNETNGVIIVRLGENKGGEDWYTLLANLSRQL